jgi:thermostable 8-oxoguanine DNA glycosylase
MQCSRHIWLYDYTCAEDVYTTVTRRLYVTVETTLQDKYADIKLTLSKDYKLTLPICTAISAYYYIKKVEHLVLDFP